jgi:hypothetical protein
VRRSLKFATDQTAPARHSASFELLHRPQMTALLLHLLMKYQQRRNFLALALLTSDLLRRR